MSKEKQEKTPKNKSVHSPQRDSQDTEQLWQERVGSHPSNALRQRINPISNIPSITAHAAMLNRAPVRQQSANRQLLLQLQRQYGNRYVQQLVQQARQQKQPVIQTKLTLGAVGDKYEREADRVAKQVVNSISATNQQPVQKMNQEEEELAQMKPGIQRMATGEATEVETSIETDIQRARGKGHPLAENVRVPMEQAFGADFSGVKVHTDSQSHQLNQSIQARAFTTRQDVFFRQGEYNPGSRSGQELIAHELTHVVQQNGGALMRSELPNTQQDPVKETPWASTSVNALEKKGERKGNSQETSSVTSQNQTSLQDDHIRGIEELSGYSMDEVREHDNNEKPTNLTAQAYTKGLEIHLVPGKEKHMPHEAWQDVLRKPGRVKEKLQKASDPIEEAVMDKDINSVKEDINKAMNKIKEKILEEETKIKSVESGLAKSGRDKMIYAPLSSLFARAQMGKLIKKWNEKWKI